MPTGSIASESQSEPSSPFAKLTDLEIVTKLGCAQSDPDAAFPCFCSCNCQQTVSAGLGSTRSRQRSIYCDQIIHSIRDYRGENTEAYMFTVLKAMYSESVCPSCQSHNIHYALMCQSVFTRFNMLLAKPLNQVSLNCTLDESLFLWLGNVAKISTILNIPLPEDILLVSSPKCNAHLLIGRRERCNNDISKHLLNQSLKQVIGSVQKSRGHLHFNTVTFFRSLLCPECYKTTGHDAYILRDWFSRFCEARQILEAKERGTEYMRIGTESLEGKMNQLNFQAASHPTVQTISVPISSFSNEEILKELKARVSRGDNPELFGKLAQLVQETLFAMTSSNTSSTGGADADTAIGGGSVAMHASNYAGGAGSPGQ